MILKIIDELFLKQELILRGKTMNSGEFRFRCLTMTEEINFVGSVFSYLQNPLLSGDDFVIVGAGIFL